jgi:hypothetical protein
MISLLARDAVRQLLRSRTLVLLVLAGALLGSFVRATQHTFEGELAGIDARGALVQSLLSGIVVFASCAALVFGVICGHEDHGSGFVAQLALRPVSRFTYAAGRAVGVAAASILAATLLGGVAVAFAGFSLDSMPVLRRVERASTVEVGGRKLATNDFASIDRGEAARFAFRSDGTFRAELRIEPQVKSVAAGAERFEGFVDLAVRARRGTEVLSTIEFTRIRPLGSLTVELRSLGPGPFDLEVENRTVGAVLIVSRDHVFATGVSASEVGQILGAVASVLFVAAIVALLGFAAATALAAGPAALAASFVLLVALARDAVSDLVGTAYPFASPVLRIVPDLARFDPSDRFARGEAVALFELATLCGSALVWCFGLFAFTALALSWRDRDRV